MAGEDNVAEEPGGYLCAYDDDLGGALELVIHDLGTAGMPREEADTRAWEWARYLADGGPPMLGWQMAIWILENEQARLIENLRAHVWPPCPEHANHPLWIGGPGPDAAWCCPRSGTAIARLGEIEG